jgi:tetratricopeptide (TPR) repeat protein
MNNRLALVSLFAAAAALVGCVESGPPAPSVKPSPAADTSAALRAIRAAGEGLDSAVQVQPLRDPAIDGFLKKAHDAEAAQDFPAAIAATDSALKLAPDAPDILQYMAELEIARGEWSKADALAMKSFSLGPKVGSLCARNWQTVVEARAATHDAATVTQAQQRLKECRVAPRLRM